MSGSLTGRVAVSSQDSHPVGGAAGQCTGETQQLFLVPKLGRGMRGRSEMDMYTFMNISKNTFILHCFRMKDIFKKSLLQELNRWLTG